jgi:hypothetical protein
MADIGQKPVARILMRAAELRQESKLRERENAPDYNVFRLIDRSHREITHDRFLANLLDPYGSHGQGPLFLRSFLKMLAENGRTFGGHAGKIAPALREVARKLDHQPPPSEWYVTRQIERIDVRISNMKESLLIFIENKVGHRERDNQIQDYEKLLDTYGRFSHRLLVLLAPKAYQVRGKPHLRLSYEKDIHDWLVQREIGAAHVHAAIMQYVQLISEWDSRAMTAYEKELVDLIDSKEHISAALDIARVLDQSDLRCRLWSRFFNAATQMLREGFSLHNLTAWQIGDHDDARESPQNGGLYCVLRNDESVRLNVGLHYFVNEAKTYWGWCSPLVLGITFNRENLLRQPREIVEIRSQLKLHGYATDQDTRGWTDADTRWWVARQRQTLPIDEHFLVSCVADCESIADHAAQLILQLLRDHGPQIERADRALIHPERVGS